MASSRIITPAGARSSEILLTREDFTQGVIRRDGHRCVCCTETSELAAHHIIERKLFHDGGYYMDNGATLCPEHHMQAEKTLLSVEDVRKAAGVTRVVVPANMDPLEKIDKWGNPVLKDGRRMRGPMFYEEQVQKILGMAGLLDEFMKYIKYPRTHHLPASPGATDDDKILRSTSAFEGERVIVSIKGDGENSSLYPDYLHARSIDGRNHPSRNWLRQFHAGIGHNIPEDWHVCGENMYAVHSIRYDNLPSWFLGFSIWNEFNVCLPWDETLEWFELIGITPVRVVYDGIFDEDEIVRISQEAVLSGEEGTVTRVARAFSYKDFAECVAKFVRPNHVQTDEHWATGDFEVNGLAEDSAFRF